MLCLKSVAEWYEERMISSRLVLARTSCSTRTERTPVWVQPFRPTSGASNRSGPKGSPQKRHIITLEKIKK